MSVRLLRMCARAFSELTERPKNNIASLDLLRTLAILLVFSGHFAFNFAASNIQKFPLVYFGWTGVDLFFVLSGYLIGYQIWKELSQTQTISITTFLLRRGFRIWPLYFSFVFFFLTKCLVLHQNGDGILADLTFTSNYFHHKIGGGWSLSTEEQFYIILPVLLVGFSKWLPPRRLILLPVGGLLALPLFRFLTIRYSGMSQTLRDWMYTPIHTHADGLAVGVILAWLAVYRPNLIRSLPFRRAAALALITAAAGLYAVNRYVFNYTSLALIFGAMTLLALGFQPGTVLDWPGFYLMSRLSYGIYLNHFGLLPIVAALLKGIAVLPAYLLGLFVCTGFAAATFTLIEAPFLRMRQRQFDNQGSSHHEEVKPLVRSAGNAS